nr:MAG TPA: hypothetical protein [Caudoviricetes sp.]
MLCDSRLFHYFFSLIRYISERVKLSSYFHMRLDYIFCLLI